MWLLPPGCARRVRERKCSNSDNSSMGVRLVFCQGAAGAESPHERAKDVLHARSGKEQADIIACCGWHAVARQLRGKDELISIAARLLLQPECGGPGANSPRLARKRGAPARSDTHRPMIARASLPSSPRPGASTYQCSAVFLTPSGIVHATMPPCHTSYNCVYPHHTHQSNACSY